MKVVHILSQHPLYLIDKTFIYFFDGEIERLCRVEIDFHGAKIYGLVLDVEDLEISSKEYEKKVGFKIKTISEKIDDRPIMSEELYGLALKIAERYMYPLIGVIQTMLPLKLRPTLSSSSASNINYVKVYEYNELNNYNGVLDEKEQDLLEIFKKIKSIDKKDAKHLVTLKRLISKGLVEEKAVEKYRYKVSKTFSYEENIVLSKAQNDVFNAVLGGKELVYLLKGITGSGKTEIYIKLVEHYIKEGKNALILVPEIGLTPLMISRVLSVFNEDLVAILHSSLSSGELYDEYRKIRDGKAKIVIGTRSSIFAPLNNIGLIVIDEEHDESYKQDDRLTYQAKDIAILRASDSNAKVILGSSTPSIESMSRAKNGKYRLLELNERYDDAKLPESVIVDRNKVENYSIISSVFSLELIKNIRDRLEKKEQVILLINNKGYSRSYYCRECGYTFKCPTCGLPLTYHKFDNTLRCHHCDYSIKKPVKCPECGSKFLGFNGFGIEKVEEDFKNIFKTNYLVLDGDRTTKSQQITSILEDFDNQKANVLIGTQIVAKGHDFKNVTLVGIMNADTSLNIDNYRANEMTFSLITQAIGRAGRGDKSGLAVIQTSQPNNATIISASKQNYNEFYKKEIINRKILKYPPFYNLISITLQTKKREKLLQNTAKIKKDFENFSDVLFIYGPTFVALKGIYFENKLFIKTKDLKSIRPIFDSFINVYKNISDLKIIININPSN